MSESPLSHRSEAWRNRSSSRRRQPAPRRARGWRAAFSCGSRGYAPSHRRHTRAAPGSRSSQIFPVSCRSSAGRLWCWVERYLLRALTESGRLPSRGGVVLGLAYRHRLVRRGRPCRRDAPAERALPRTCRGCHQPAAPLGGVGALQAPVADNQRRDAARDHWSRAWRRLASASGEPGWRGRHRIDRRDRRIRGGDGERAAFCRRPDGSRREHVVAERRARVAVAALASGSRRGPRGPVACRESRRCPAARPAWSRDRVASSPSLPCTWARSSGAHS